MILALDPSSKMVGWAVMELNTVHGCGAFKPEGDTFDQQLAHISESVEGIGNTYFGGKGSELPACAIEVPFYHPGHRNVRTVKVLAQIVGAIRLTVFPWVTQVIEVLPANRLTALGLPGNMKRDPAKAAVRRNVNAIYGLELTGKQHDIADAIAVGREGILKLQTEKLYEAAGGQ